MASSENPLTPFASDESLLLFVSNLKLKKAQKSQVIDLK